MNPEIPLIIHRLKQYDEPGMAISVRNLSEEVQQLHKDLYDETQRRKLAEKMLLQEFNKSLWEKIFC